MASWHISRFEARPASAVVLRYGAAVTLVAAALGTALILRSENLPHPFTSFSFAANSATGLASALPLSKVEIQNILSRR